jgi:hypothetical protein
VLITGSIRKRKRPTHACGVAEVREETESQ